MYAGWTWCIISLFVLGCGSLDSGQTTNTEYSIFLSHTRLDNNDSIYGKVQDIDFSKFRYTLLGGDLAVNSFENKKIFSLLNAEFDLKSKNTLWSIGNHDSVSDKAFFEHTGKRKFHLYQENDVSFIVLDTQDSLSSIVGEQKKFFYNVIDTISTKKVVVLSHKLIFMDKHPVMDSMINKTCNGSKGRLYYSHNKNNFQKDILPKLLELKAKDKTIVWIGGDLGVKTSKFEYIDENGLVYLGNGIGYKKKDNYVILIKNAGQLKYKFVHIDTLIARQDQPTFLSTLFE